MTVKLLSTPHNFIVQGKHQAYDAWQIRPEEFLDFHGNQLLFLACYVTLPRTYHYFYAAYLREMACVPEKIPNRIVFRYILLYVENTKIANEILFDVNPELTLNGI
ncbi:MAG: hypothetical protein EOO50_16850 [Flavobacterium sp.]|uniref:hypothetical protein n=1 Tax=Flavobacterium sp. TaxID=239 RepID=UPI001224E764|nr:hypothetical protein [Flavobacterium sp.]RZJ63378.1 MAG: hypothetical protein EOO50_16850 [Flavobacterium sp.]